MLTISIAIVAAIAIGAVAPFVKAVFRLWQAVPRRNADMVLF